MRDAEEAAGRLPAAFFVGFAISVETSSPAADCRGARPDSAGYYYLIFKRKPGAVALAKSFGQSYWEH